MSRRGSVDAAVEIDLGDQDQDQDQLAQLLQQAIQRGPVIHRSANDGYAITLGYQADSVEPGGPAGIEVPRESDFVPAGIVMMAGRHVVHRCPPMLRVRMGLTEVCEHSLPRAKSRSGCDEHGSPRLVIDVVTPPIATRWDGSTAKGDVIGYDVRSLADGVRPGSLVLLVLDAGSSGFPATGTRHQVEILGPADRRPMVVHAELGVHVLRTRSHGVQQHEQLTSELWPVQVGSEQPEHVGSRALSRSIRSWWTGLLPRSCRGLPGLGGGLLSRLGLPPAAQ
jgi:hypothetical protein